MRISHLLWLFAVLISPPRLCERLVAFRFIPGARSDGLCKIMAMLGLVRRREALETPLAAMVSGQAGALDMAPRASPRCRYRTMRLKQKRADWRR